KTRVARRGQGQTLGQGSSANRSSFHPLCLLGESPPATGHPEKPSALDHGTEQGGALRKDEISLPAGAPQGSVHECFTVSPAWRQQRHRRVALVPLWNRPSGRSRRRAPGASPTLDRLAASLLPVPIRPPSAGCGSRR